MKHGFFAHGKEQKLILKYILEESERAREKKMVVGSSIEEIIDFFTHLFYSRVLCVAHKPAHIQSHRILSLLLHTPLSDDDESSDDDEEKKFFLVDVNMKIFSPSSSSVCIEGKL